MERPVTCVTYVSVSSGNVWPALEPVADAMRAGVVGGGGKAGVAKLLAQGTKELGRGRKGFMRIEWIA